MKKSSDLVCVSLVLAVLALCAVLASDACFSCSERKKETNNQVISSQFCYLFDRSCVHNSCLIGQSWIGGEWSDAGWKCIESPPHCETDGIIYKIKNFKRTFKSDFFLKMYSIDPHPFSPIHSYFFNYQKISQNYHKDFFHSKVYTVISTLVSNVQNLFSSLLSPSCAHASTQHQSARMSLRSAMERFKGREEEKEKITERRKGSILSWVINSEKHMESKKSSPIENDRHASTLASHQHQIFFPSAFEEENFLDTTFNSNHETNKVRNSQEDSNAVISFRPNQKRKNKHKITTRHKPISIDADNYIESRKTTQRPRIPLLQHQKANGNSQKPQLKTSHLQAHLRAPRPPELIEGDIALTLEQSRILTQSKKRRRKRKLTESLTKKWNLPIAYTIESAFGPKERWIIRQALDHWQSLTCITFVEDASAEHKLSFSKQNGCWSFVGYTGQKEQTVSLERGCQTNGSIAHEVGHAVGFWHEHSRPDRDLYVEVLPQNVRDGKVSNFEMRSWAEILNFDLPYDPGSDMHYGSKFYAKDVNQSLTTIQTRDPMMSMVIGQRQELSFYDVKLANMAYCSEKCEGQKRSCRRDGYRDPLKCEACRCPDGFDGRSCEAVQQGVRAKCGGVLDASYGGFIFSPRYVFPGYQAGVKCSWLIKAPEHHQIYLDFMGKFGLNCHKDVCKDFVEVRYNSSMSLTGARFCCTERPRGRIKSTTNEMLVLLRSFQESKVCQDEIFPWKCITSNVGFKASFYSRACGGFDNAVAVQTACLRRVAYRCEQAWEESVKVDCPKWWSSKSCGLKSLRKMRQSTCSRDVAYCSPAFKLNKSSLTCIAKLSASTNINFDSKLNNKSFEDDLLDNYNTRSTPVHSWQRSNTLLYNSLEKNTQEGFQARSNKQSFEGQKGRYGKRINKTQMFNTYEKNGNNKNNKDNKNNNKNSISKNQNTYKKMRNKIRGIRRGCSVRCGGGWLYQTKICPKKKYCRDKSWRIEGKLCNQRACPKRCPQCSNSPWCNKGFYLSRGFCIRKP